MYVCVWTVGIKRWFHEWKAILIAAVVGITVLWGLVRWQKDSPIALICAHDFLLTPSVVC